MELIDTHCHLYDQALAGDIENVIQRAVAAGVVRFYLPAIDRQSEAGMLELENRYPDICFAMQGLHPCSVKADFNSGAVAAAAIFGNALVSWVSALCKSLSCST